MALLRALVVDDHALMRVYIGVILQACGFDFVGAADGVEALQQASPGGIELIVTDLEMPRLNGLEFLKQVMCGAFGDTPPPIIVCSTKLDERRIVDRLGELGDFVMLPKPFRPSGLVNAVRAAFANAGTIAM